ncbi:MAG: radical SAM protein [Candidatus Aminicenantes bacterium]|nr:radical SAM protein [Candidatus Aminicenantes bacterium]NIM81269.1 radical SAM protein [Candidatus Aminicenantes bacterium]NIN20671.1 radical SAM protein [Candidatus Aminicenantes bacterium]NIN44447.1 radical SAM protein [Candidatus Aminicenantes bacterium]NIN87269.1 radical SAM protein [Candidatus Aminicenantes bacterium]
MFNPVNKAEETARVVCRGDLRKYYRFRPARFYGGIATTDCVGCGLRCLFCWSWQNLVKPESAGFFCSPKEVAKNLLKIARKKHFYRLRISGNEPTIAREHLLKVLEQIPGEFRFILETNGILIGHDKTYAEDLARFENLYVRVSLKGTTEEEFSALTGAAPSGFELQIKALENLYRAGVQVHPAVMISFSPLNNLKPLQQRLAKITPAFRNIEIEELMLYGHVEERLRKAGFQQTVGQ